MIQFKKVLSVWAGIFVLGTPLCSFAKIYVDYVQDPIPMVDLTVVLPIGSRSYEPGRAAKFNVLDNVIEGGTANKTSQEMQDILGQYAASFSFGVGLENSSWKLSFPYLAEKDYSSMVNVLQENWQTPRFNGENFELARIKLRSAIMGSLDSDFNLLQSGIRRMHQKANFAAEPVFIENIDQLKLADVQKVFVENFQSNFDVWVGVVGPESARAVVEKTLKSVFSKQGEIVYQEFKEKAVPRAEIRKAPFRKKQSVILIDKPDREQLVTGLVTVNSESMNWEEEVAFVFGNHLLTEHGFGSYFMDEIRTKRGLAYAVHPVARYFNGHSSLGFLSNPVANRGEEALGVIRGLLENGYQQATYIDTFSDDAWRETERVFHDDVKIYLNENVFGENGIPLVDLRGAKNISVVSKNATTSLIASSIETLSRNKPPPLILKKIAGCCFFGIPPHLASKYAEALKARSFQSKEVRFLSLVRDSATEAAIRNAPHVQKANLRESGKVLNLADIEASFKDAKGKTVVLIGHVEGENFVTRNARSEVALSVSIHDLRASASKYGIELIDLGCRTAQQISKDSLGVGVTTRFNTVDAVNSINRAMSHSKNYEEFFENLTSGGLKVVVDGEFARGSALRAEIYSEQKASARRFWVPIADIFVTFISKK